MQYPCPDHSEEELTYFCFSCNNPICPECAIHGLHKDHEVQTTRKAIKQIRGLLGEDKGKLDQTAADLLAGRDLRDLGILALMVHHQGARGWRRKAGESLGVTDRDSLSQAAHHAKGVGSGQGTHGCDQTWLRQREHGWCPRGRHRRLAGGGWRWSE